jgi:hypothetical protein
MAYRGEDLDLRTVQTWPPERGNFDRGSAERGGDDAGMAGVRARHGAYRPLLVDEVLLACCNHAYEVAAAHRAAEVRLEHLIHAMTRVEPAAAMLEARGVRVAPLRRETVTIIAGEIPVGLGAGPARPRRSDDLESLLRQATAASNRRGIAGTVDDVVDVLIEMPADVPGATLLVRHGARLVRDRLYRDAGARDALPLPPLSRSGPATEVRFDSEWTRRPTQERPTYDRAAYELPRGGRPAGASRGDRERDVLRDDDAAVDGPELLRIEHLEGTLRQLTAELAAERTAVTRAVEDLRGGLDSRLAALQQVVVETTRPPAERAELLDRMVAVEQMIAGQATELSRPWSILSDRLQGLEQAVLDTRHAARATDIVPLQERLVGIERAVRDTTAEGSRTQAGIVDRLKQMERLVDTLASRTVDLTPVVNRLDIIEEAVLTQPAPAAARSIDDEIAARVRALEESLLAQRSVLQQAASAIDADIKALATALASQAAGADRAQTAVVERIQALAAGLEGQRAEVLKGIDARVTALAADLDGRTKTTVQALTDATRTSADLMAARTAETTAAAASKTTAAILERLTAIATAFDGGVREATRSAAAPLGERLDALAKSIGTVGEKSDAVVKRVEALLAPVVERLGRIEAALATNAQRAVELQAQHVGELKEVHEALFRLNTNQHTLAGSIDQWRLDGVNDVTAIATRLTTIERQTGQPTVMLEQLTASVDNIGRATVERYHRRNRFWYWLFGTDDWLGASWPSQVAAVERERLSLRGTPARTTSVPQKPAAR